MTEKKPLRVGVLIDSFEQPQWVLKIIADIQASTVADVVLLIKNGTAHRKETLWRRLLAHRKHLLYIAYRKLDHFLFPTNPDAFALGDMRPLVSACPVLEVAPRQTKYSDYFPEEELVSIKTYDLDVALRFGFRILRGAVLACARYGVWSYHHGDNQVNRGGPAGFWEVMKEIPVTGSVLQVLTEDLDAGRALYRSFAKTDRRSARRNRNNFYWKSSAFVLRALNDVYERGEPALENNSYEARHAFYSHPLYKKPTNAQMLCLFVGLTVRYLRDVIANRVSFHQWILAYDLRPEAQSAHRSLHRFTLMMPPKDRFWADPFPVKRDDTYYIFLEEYPYRRHKGHIAVIEMDEKGRWEKPRTVLEQAYHLSYPFIFTWQDDYYMIPETMANQTIELYRCTSFPFTWDLEATLMHGVRAVDTTLHEQDGLWWMFTTMAVEGSLNYDELYLFYAETPLGPWSPHPQNPVKSDVRSARSAGGLFAQEGVLYRPAQDCSVRYGYAISLNHLRRIDRQEYGETVVSKILPSWRPDLRGTHTLNYTDGLTVVDALLHRRRFW